MAKAKASKGTGSISNKALHSRVSYLYQAAAYLATQRPHSKTAQWSVSESEDGQQTESLQRSSPFTPASRRLISNLRSVSLKVQMRISPTMKQSMCKNCDTMLFDGKSCSTEIENKSNGGKKPWADVLVRKCSTCGLERRFPLSTEKQKRRPNRLLEYKLPEKNHGALEGRWSRIFLYSSKKNDWLILEQFWMELTKLGVDANRMQIKATNTWN
jgi:ribonuclease P protein subunit RPR2